jgi:predicted alpha/beta hydrolase family esterase
METPGQVPREQKVIEMLRVECRLDQPATEDHVTVLIEERDEAWVDVKDDGFHLFAHDGSFTWYEIATLLRRRG